ncbi:effector-associated constant component EACC1 [[Actinomadura] parvosata]|uniref:effector-associated constant component EACC1 n=1 Tax=[Actinomadura] parvosata TaxID=1955412 RepID=UPI00406CC4E2
MTSSDHASTAASLRATLALQADPDTDPEREEHLMRRLRGEINDLDVESVALVAAGDVPHGAKGADLVTLGALLVAFSASGGVFTTLIAAIQNWLDRQTGRHRIAVTIDGDTIELERASAAQQRELLEAFIQRHSSR